MVGSRVLTLVTLNPPPPLPSHGSSGEDSADFRLVG